jgi:hypothetical protein
LRTCQALDINFNKLPADCEWLINVIAWLLTVAKPRIVFGAARGSKRVVRDHIKKHLATLASVPATEPAQKFETKLKERSRELKKVLKKAKKKKKTEHDLPALTAAMAEISEVVGEDPDSNIFLDIGHRIYKSNPTFFWSGHAHKTALYAAFLAKIAEDETRSSIMLRNLIMNSGQQREEHGEGAQEEEAQEEEAQDLDDLLSRFGVWVIG